VGSSSLCSLLDVCHASQSNAQSLFRKVHSVWSSIYLPFTLPLAAVPVGGFTLQSQLRRKCPFNRSTKVLFPRGVSVPEPNCFGNFVFDYLVSIQSKQHLELKPAPVPDGGQKYNGWESLDKQEELRLPPLSQVRVHAALLFWLLSHALHPSPKRV